MGVLCLSNSKEMRIFTVISEFHYEGRVPLLSHNEGTTKLSLTWERNTTQYLICRAALQCQPDINC